MIQDRYDRGGRFVPPHIWRFRDHFGAEPVRSGVPERTAMKPTGDKARRVFERYNIVSDGDLGDAARKLDRTAPGTAR